MGEFILGLAIGGVITTLISSFMYYIVFSKDKENNMNFTELTAETIERDYCPRCKYYIDKQFIYKDENIQITMGIVKECKFRTDTSWICDFKENKNE